jgi:hypothetical protein
MGQKLSGKRTVDHQVMMDMALGGSISFKSTIEIVVTAIEKK